MVDKTFEETCKPIWTNARRMGLTEKDINNLIDEARTKSHTSKRK